MSKLKAKNQNLKLKAFFYAGFFLLSTLYYLLSIPTPIRAQITITPTFYGSPFSEFGKLVGVLIANAYIIAGIVILFLLVFGGLSIIKGAGAGDQQKTGQGKQAFTAAIIGFLIIFASYWIIQIVQFITGVKILTP